MPGNRYSKALAGLEKQHRLRALVQPVGLDFASNDYLGLAHHPAIKQAIVDALDAGMSVGAGASRLLRGNHQAHEDLESFAAGFFGTQAALYMSTGYAANFALFTTLTARGDTIFYDELSHASTREGIYASRADHVAIAHNEPQAFEDALKAWTKTGSGRAWIAVESLYSMDGDTAPLEALAQIAVRYGAMLVIDEAHATGVHGPNGRGFAETLGPRDNLIMVHTCGKALGSQGALICSTQEIKNYLINKCRPFIFSTGPSPLLAVAVKTALTIIDTEPQRRSNLAAMYQTAHQRLSAFTGLSAQPSQILPVIVGDDARAMNFAQKLQARGFDVRPIRPPTVAEGTARLRVSITLNVSLKDVTHLMDALETLLQDAFAQ
jgi:8-amino-7-oxononanoate synthase